MSAKGRMVEIEIGQHHAEQCFQKPPQKDRTLCRGQTLQPLSSGFWNRNYWIVLSSAKGTIQLDCFLKIAREPKIYPLPCFAQSEKQHKIKKNRTEILHCAFEVHGSIKNSFEVLSLFCILSGQWQPSWIQHRASVNGQKCLA